MNSKDWVEVFMTILKMTGFFWLGTETTDPDTIEVIGSTALIVSGFYGSKRIKEM